MVIATVGCDNCVMLRKQLITASQGLKSMQPIIAFLREEIKKSNLPDAKKTINPIQCNETITYENVK